MTTEGRRHHLQQVRTHFIQQHIYLQMYGLNLAVKALFLRALPS